MQETCKKCHLECIMDKCIACMENSSILYTYTVYRKFVQNIKFPIQ